MSIPFTQGSFLPGRPSPVEVRGAKGYFEELNRILCRMPHQTVDRIARVLVKAYERNRVIYLFGNGGSAALASHFACDLGKGIAMRAGRRFRVLSLTDNVPMLTAWANDARYEDVFAEQLRNFVASHDIVIAISGSGNSPNVLNGLKLARESGAYTIGLTGFGGGKMKDLCDICLVVPSDNMQFVEDLHVCVSHAIFTIVRNQLKDQQIPVVVPTPRPN